MISFKVIKTSGDVSEFLTEISSIFESPDLLCEIEEMLLSYIEETEAEFAVSVAEACLLVRIYDGEYLFLCPIPIGENSSIMNAAEEIRKYAIKQEIPITFIDVPEGDVDGITENFRFASMHSMDEDGDVYMVKAMTELDQMEKLPNLSGKKVSLTPIYEKYIADYGRLCRSEQVNRLFGYDYKEDFTDPDDRLFYDIMDREKDAGLALSMAIIYDGKFAGEASIFAFDYVGGARIAIRLLPEFWGCGIGSESLELTIKLAKEMDLRRIYTDVKLDNVGSIKMTEKFMTRVRDEGENAIFELELREPLTIEEAYELAFNT